MINNFKSICHTFSLFVLSILDHSRVRNRVSSHTTYREIYDQNSIQFIRIRTSSEMIWKLSALHLALEQRIQKWHCPPKAPERPFITSRWNRGHHKLGHLVFPNLADVHFSSFTTHTTYIHIYFIYTEKKGNSAGIKWDEVVIVFNYALSLHCTLLPNNAGF